MVSKKAILAIIVVVVVTAVVAIGVSFFGNRSLFLLKKLKTPLTLM